MKLDKDTAFSMLAAEPMYVLPEVREVLTAAHGAEGFRKMQIVQARRHAEVWPDKNSGPGLIARRAAYEKTMASRQPAVVAAPAAPVVTAPAAPTMSIQEQVNHELHTRPRNMSPEARAWMDGQYGKDAAASMRVNAAARFDSRSDFTVVVNDDVTTYGTEGTTHAKDKGASFEVDANALMGVKRPGY